jgi:hypothetical protein
MPKPETDSYALLVDGEHPLRKQPRLLVRLAGLGLSLAAIAGALYWASYL